MNPTLPKDFVSVANNRQIQNLRNQVDKAKTMAIMINNRINEIRSKGFIYWVGKIRGGLVARLKRKIEELLRFAKRAQKRMSVIMSLNARLSTQTTYDLSDS